MRPTVLRYILMKVADASDTVFTIALGPASFPWTVYRLRL